MISMRFLVALFFVTASLLIPNFHTLNAAEMDMHGMEMDEMSCEGDVCEVPGDARSCIEHCLELAADQEVNLAVIQTSEDDGVDQEQSLQVVPRDSQIHIQPLGPIHDPGSRFILQQRE